MKDIIIGLVTEIVDSKTIRIDVSQIVRIKSGPYGSTETIRCKSLQHELRPVKHTQNIRFIESLLKGKGVMCLINGRDANGYIEADVYGLEK